ncbi:hypothetical protein TgHK011_003008 [Trichoderma gracile]|nr:hypothetical protein TgHK011_003008 [Trichoderma gracile]
MAATEYSTGTGLNVRAPSQKYSYNRCKPIVPKASYNDDDKRATKAPWLRNKVITHTQLPSCDRGTSDRASCSSPRRRGTVAPPFETAEIDRRQSLASLLPLQLETLETPSEQISRARCPRQQHPRPLALVPPPGCLDSTSGLFPSPWKHQQAKEEAQITEYEVPLQHVSRISSKCQPPASSSSPIPRCSDTPPQGPGCNQPLSDKRLGTVIPQVCPPGPSTHPQDAHESYQFPLRTGITESVYSAPSASALLCAVSQALHPMSVDQSTGRIDGFVVFMHVSCHKHCVLFTPHIMQTCFMSTFQDNHETQLGKQLPEISSQEGSKTES